jgi:hypothetical protein
MILPDFVRETGCLESGRLGSSWLWAKCVLFMAHVLTGSSLVAGSFTPVSLGISGDWQESWLTFEEEEVRSVDGVFSYTTAVDPGLAVTVSSQPFGWGTAGAVLSPLSLNLNANSAPSTLEYDWGIGSISPTWIHIFATATNRFQVDGPVLEVLWLGYADFNYRLDEQDFSLVLTDVTSTTTLLDLRASTDWSPWREAGFNGFYQLAVDPVHEYEVVLSGWITSFDAKYAELHSQVEVTVVPEPGVALLFLVGGAFLRMCMRGMPAAPPAHKTADH